MSLAIFDNQRLVQQAVHLLSRYRMAVRNNLLGFRIQAQAQSVPVAQLAASVNGQAALVMDKIGKIEALVADPTRRARLLDGLSRLGITQAEAVAAKEALKTAGLNLQNAPKTTYAEIVAAINGFLSDAPAPESFWPE